MSNTEADAIQRLIEMSYVWQHCRDLLNDADPQAEGYDQTARDFQEAECALSLSIRLLKRADKTAKGTRKS